MSLFTLVLAFSALACCAGAAFACLLCMCLGKLLHRAYLPARFILFCVLLSAVCAGSAALVIFERPLFSILVGRPSLLAFFAALFCLAFACALSWKLLFPLAVLVYVAGAATTGICLYTLFGAQKDRISLAVQEDGLQADGEFFPGSGRDGFAVSVYTLPETLLFPLPRTWYVPGEKNLHDDIAAMVQGRPFPALLTRYMAWCLKSGRVEFVPLGQEASAGMLYTCTVSRAWGRIAFSVRRDL